MKLIYPKGFAAANATQIVDIFIQDSSSTTGAGKTGLTAANSPDTLHCYRARQDDGNTGGVQITLTSATRGTFTSGGFVEKDAVFLPGVYEFGIPTTALATGSNFVLIMFAGGTNVAPCVLEIQLVDWINTANTAVPVTSAVKRGTATASTALAAFTFVMTDSTTHAPKSGIGSGWQPTRSIDGGTFANTTNTVTEVATGTYKIDLSGNDLNGNNIMLRFTASGADDLNILLITQP
jgi:hypothetical protein